MLTIENIEGKMKLFPKKNEITKRKADNMKLDLKRIKAERVASGMTQSEVANKLGWKSRTPYAKRENGIVPFGADELASFGEVVGYTTNELGIFFTKDVPEKERIETKGVK